MLHSPEIIPRETLRPDRNRARRSAGVPQTTRGGSPGIRSPCSTPVGAWLLLASIDAAGSRRVSNKGFSLFASVQDPLGRRTSVHCRLRRCPQALRVRRERGTTRFHRSADRGTMTRTPNITETSHPWLRFPLPPACPATSTSASGRPRVAFGACRRTIGRRRAAGRSVRYHVECAHHRRPVRSRRHPRHRAPCAGRVAGTRGDVDRRRAEAARSSPPWLLAPCDLQAIKAPASPSSSSLLERVIEEQARGDAAQGRGAARDDRQASIGDESSQHQARLGRGRAR